MSRYPKVFCLRFGMHLSYSLRMLCASLSLTHTIHVIAYWFILYIYKVFNVLTKMRWQHLSLPEILYPLTRQHGIVTQMTITQTSNLLCS